VKINETSGENVRQFVCHLNVTRAVTKINVCWADRLTDVIIIIICFKFIAVLMTVMLFTE
jgi:hypothetical protein